jgi:D-alanine-D-alanine ligase
LRALGHEVFAGDTATGRLPPAQERQLLTSGVAAEPPSSAVIEQMRGRASEFTPSAADIRSADVAYTGSIHIASAVAIDKDIAKRLFRSVGVPTAEWLMAPAEIADVEKILGWPVVVKPNKQGSTVGLTVVRRSADLAAAV